MQLASNSKRPKLEQSSVYKPTPRTSTLDSPTMLLSGHTSAVLSCAFSPTSLLATAGIDTQVLLWNITGNCPNYGILKAQTKAVLQVAWNRNSTNIAACSADQSVAWFDVNTQNLVRKFTSHTAIVNSVAVSKRGKEMLCSGGDDDHIYLHDPLTKQFTSSFDTSHPVLACTFSADGTLVYSGGTSNIISVTDLRTGNELYGLIGHEDTITGLAISPDGSKLLSQSLDNTAIVWDIRPFSSIKGRLIHRIEGCMQGIERNLVRPCWHNDSEMIACGGDIITIWRLNGANNAGGRKEMCEVLYRLGGHKGTVNQVAWNGPVIASASSDGNIMVGELDLQ